MTALSRPAGVPHATDRESGPPSADDARITAILDEYGTLLRQAVARACPRDLGISTADVEQDARIRLWRALQRESEIHDLASYIYRIAATATIDAIRRVKARREAAMPESPEADGAGADLFVSRDASPEEEAAGRSLSRAIEKGLGRLARRRRRAVGLHLQGLSTREIGAVLGWSEPTARNLVHRGLKDLRRVLREMGIGDGTG